VAIQRRDNVRLLAVKPGAAAVLFLAIATHATAQMAMQTSPKAIPAPKKTAALAPGKVRSYYIAADEVKWDYAPRGRNLTGTPAVENESAEGGRSTIFLKAIYREYTDASFKTLKPRPPEWEHLGLLGPLIRAEVGDTIKVIFRNNATVPYSMHPHGVAYDKKSEGAFYNDGTAGAEKADDLVAPGKTYTYTWAVPVRAGPGPGDPSSILWMYHSHFVETRDMNTGLLGPIVIGRRGSGGADGRPRDVDREFVAAFAIFDETASAYYEANVANRPPGGRNLRVTDPAFRNSYLMYSINGFIDGNLPLLTMKKGERVRWYLMSNSNEEDVHGAHWHGETAIVSGMRTDTVPLGPMAMTVADMVPDNVGTWLFHCHVNEHYEGGMQALFRVTP
jgi:FtsP/CotA-like multicopper oxidase with cupredoxin domain